MPSVTTVVVIVVVFPHTINVHENLQKADVSFAYMRQIFLWFGAIVKYITAYKSVITLQNFAIYKFMFALFTLRLYGIFTMILLFSRYFLLSLFYVDSICCCFFFSFIFLQKYLLMDKCTMKTDCEMKKEKRKNKFNSLLIIEAGNISHYKMIFNFNAKKKRK